MSAERPQVDTTALDKKRKRFRAASLALKRARREASTAKKDYREELAHCQEQEFKNALAMWNANEGEKSASVLIRLGHLLGIPTAPALDHFDKQSVDAEYEGVMLRLPRAIHVHPTHVALRWVKGGAPMVVRFYNGDIYGAETGERLGNVWNPSGDPFGPE